MKKTPILLLFLLIFQVGFTVSAQNEKQVIQKYLEQNKTSLGLGDDVDNFIINSKVFSESTGITSVHIQQTISGIPINGAVANAAVKNGQVVHFGNRLITDAQVPQSGLTATLSPLEAVESAAAQLNLQINGDLEIVNIIDPRNVLLSKAGLSANEIPVKMVFQPVGKELKLAWDMNIHTLDGKHWWSLRVDAQNGNILSKNDWVVSCTFSDHTHHQRSSKQKNLLNSEEATSSVLLNDGSQYNVYAFPTESPDDGPRSIVSNPADDIASPYGWHDTDGVDGAEHTITRGNNVYAQEDLDANNDTFGYAPDGGTNLSFDFTYNGDADPAPGYLDAAITNLFYVNNVMHDVWYQYGFDEPAGNFQEFNYSNEGAAGDFVIADAQDAVGFNNANFSTPSDGYNPRMQMFLWSPVIANALTVNNTPVAGSYKIVDNVFDPGHVDPPAYPNVLTGDLALAEDDTADVTDACTALTNPTEIAGKIAVVRRGSCNFTMKVLNAQNAGAIAVIVVNNEAGNDVNMSGAEAGITIPAVFINMTDGEALIAEMANSTVSVSMTDPSGLYSGQDGDLDNSIVAHEYGHGISNRLTGGPSNSNCLYTCVNTDSEGNCIQFSEQMGEGWSDWFALMLTIEAGDVAEDPRGIATYSSGIPTGIRPVPYSTSFAVNDYTYGDTNDETLAAPHGIGFVWGTILWDLTWRLIEDHGFDPDVYNGTGGNNIAMQLVIDGLKLQPCNPGFVDGRDAILAADMALTGGANQCAIWEVFANRGVGAGAAQGWSLSRTDQVESFDLPEFDNPTSCTMGVKNIVNENNLQIHPNPSKGIINISSTLANVNEASVDIYDMNGRLVLSRKAVDLNNATPIDASHLSTGVYVVKITADGTMYTQKLIMN